MRELFYTESGEFWPFDMPELESTTLEDVDNERLVDYSDLENESVITDWRYDQELKFD